MGRFDNELIKNADNAYQMYKLPEPAQQGGFEQNQFMPPFAESFPPTSAPVDDVAKFQNINPVRRMIQVTDLDASGQDVMGGPGSSAVFASVEDNLDETLYQVYKASREIRDAITAGVEFDFDRLFTATNNCADFSRTASLEPETDRTIQALASLVEEIENNLFDTQNYHQANSDLQSLEALAEDINKYAFFAIEAEEVTRLPRKEKKEYKKQLSEKDMDTVPPCPCGTPGCPGCDNVAEVHASVKTDIEARRERLAHGNGREETLQQDDVRALDNVAPYENVGPDMTVDVTAPQPVNGEDAGYVDFYNDGAETGINPAQLPHGQETFPMDQTNPAFVEYNRQMVAGREKIFEALQVVERLEKLGMVREDDRAKHIAKFEQMSDAKLAGFKASLDMLEESGARQPRSQKVASGNNNRMPEMGRLTTASTTTRESILADDWLMTL
jgi:hypothetical protein